MSRAVDVQCQTVRAFVHSAYQSVAVVSHWQMIRHSPLRHTHLLAHQVHMMPSWTASVLTHVGSVFGKELSGVIRCARDVTVR